MRPPTNTSAPRMLFPPTPNRQSLHSCGTLRLMRHPSAPQSYLLQSTPKQECGHGRIPQIQIGPKTCFQIRLRPHPATDWPHLRDRPATTIGRLRPLSDTGKRVSPAPVVSRQLQEWCQGERSKSESAQRNGEPGIQPSPPHQGWQPGRPAPFLILPFPYPGSLCIMNPYPPQHQERTPL